MAQAATHRGGYRRSTRKSKDDADYDNSSVVDERRQHVAYGGMHWGAAVYGWLVSTGIASILTAILGAAGSAVAVTSIDKASNVSGNTVQTVGLVSGIVFLLVLAIAYYAGGYVAGRLSRFDGARQGVATWIIGVIVTLILGGVGAALGAKYNILQQLNLPHLPIGSSFTTGGLIASLLALVVTLAAAVTGGKTGEQYHRKIDAEGSIGTAHGT
jgi:MFS family permease